MSKKSKISKISNFFNVEMCSFFSFGDNVCDDVNNRPMCNFDGGDCVQECHQPGHIGNGICNQDNNNKECAWDGGDCCLINDSETYCTDPGF
jgi:hypothetical protein